MGMVFTVAMVAQTLVIPKTGKYYRIVNQNPDKAVSTEGESHGVVIQENRITNSLTAVSVGDDTAYSQIWRCTGGNKFQNALTRRYIGDAYISQLMTTSTTEKALTLEDKSTYFIIKASNGNMLHADGSNKLVGWNDGGNKSNWWCFEEVTVNTADLKAAQDKYDDEQERKGTLEDIANRESEIAPIIEAYFTDGACTVLKDQYKSLRDEELRDNMRAQNIPDEVQNMVINIKNEWASEFNPEMSKRFRVRSLISIFMYSPSEPHRLSQVICELGLTVTSSTFATSSLSMLIWSR